MIRKRTLIIRSIYVALDILFIMGSFVLACWIRRRTVPFPITLNHIFFDMTNPFQIVFVCWALALVLINFSTGLYQTRREILESQEIGQVFRSVGMATVVAMVFIYVFKVEGFPRSIFIFSAVFQAVSLSAWRAVKRQFVSFLVSQGYNNFNVLIIGAGKVGMALVREIEKRPEFGLRVKGFLDDFKPKGEKCAGYPILGRIEDFARVAPREFINKIFITIHHDSHVFLRLLEQARALRIAVRVIPQGFEFSTGDFCKYNIGLIPVLEYCDEEHRIQQAGKRLFDVVTASCLLILLLPVFIGIALLIKFDSPGPIFYVSRRYGRKGRVFGMLKFRSMVQDADQHLPKLKPHNEADGPIFKLRRDPRVTRLGRWLRRYSLDELPQIINVIKGDMSLVGPRPLPIDQIEKEDWLQLQRLEVRPGITGLWQIRGRSDLSFSRLLRWDVWYINNWSFWLDVNILLQTIPVVLKGRGAY